MDDNEFGRLLKQLHGTIEGTSTSSLTEKDRELLRQLTDDVQRLLARPGAISAGGHQTMIDRLQSAVTSFEVSHPELTATMAQVSKTLADMGI